MFCSALPYAQQLCLDLPLITYQGALVKTSASAEVIYQKYLSQVYAREIITLAQENHLHVNVYYNDQLYVEKISNEGKLYAKRSRTPFQVVNNLLDLVREDPIKVLVVGEEERLDQLAEKCRKQFQDAVYITKSEPFFLEFLNPMASKGKALRLLATHLNIDREQIIAIGDSYNDLDMFRNSGLSVAMGNARQEIKQAADYVTGTNNDDGVATVIEKFVLR
jgi:hypothetical protein